MLLVLVGMPTVQSALADDPTPPPGQDCPGGDGSHFYAYDGDSGDFGPAVRGSLDETLDTLAERRRCDPLLTAVHLSYESGQGMRPAAIEAAAVRFTRSAPAWQAALDTLEQIEGECQAKLDTRSNSYQTLGMQRGNNRNVMPSIYQATPNRPRFDVLVFDCGGARKFVYKLDCGFQPVAQSFPHIPSTPVPPTVNVPPGPPPPNPPPTTPPPNPPCTTYPCGKPYVPPSDDTCNLPDDLCHPGTGPSTPRPPDPHVPTPTVAPPPSVPPPTVAPPPSQPPVTQPVPTIPDGVDGQVPA